MTSRISSKGQITVPADIRDKMGLLPGTVVEFKITPQGALLRKRVKPSHPIDRLYGLLKSPGRTDDFLDAMRGPRPAKT
jgi:AbrB family looped-hinge helix DNA binding protein